MGRNQKNIPLIATTILAIIMFWYIYENPLTFNMNSEVGTTLISLIPATISGFISVWVISESSSYGLIGGIMGLGLSLCFFIGEAYDLGLISVSMLGGISLYQAQVWIMAMSILFGGLLYTYKK